MTLYLKISQEKWPSSRICQVGGKQSQVDVLELISWLPPQVITSLTLKSGSSSPEDCVGNLFTGFTLEKSGCANRTRLESKYQCMTVHRGHSQSVPADLTYFSSTGTQDAFAFAIITGSASCLEKLTLNEVQNWEAVLDLGHKLPKLPSKCFKKTQICQQIIWWWMNCWLRFGPPQDWPHQLWSNAIDHLLLGFSYNWTEASWSLWSLPCRFNGWMGSQLSERQAHLPSPGSNSQNSPTDLFTNTEIEELHISDCDPDLVTEVLGAVSETLESLVFCQTRKSCLDSRYLTFPTFESKWLSFLRL